MRHSSTQAHDDDRREVTAGVVREPLDFTPYPLSDSDPYADAELQLRKERTETMIRRAQEAAT